MAVGGLQKHCLQEHLSKPIKNKFLHLWSSPNQFDIVVTTAVAGNQIWFMGLGCQMNKAESQLCVSGPHDSWECPECEEGATCVTVAGLSRCQE